MLSYGFGRSLVGFMSCCAPTATPARTSTAAVLMKNFTPASLEFSILHSSFLDVPFDAARADFRAVDDAVHVGCDAFGGTRHAGTVGVRFRIGNEGGDAAVSRAADAQSALPSRVEAVLAFDVARFRIGGVERVVLVDEEAARPAELLPFRDPHAVLIEDLNAVVAPGGDEQTALRIHREAVRMIELAASRSSSSPGLDQHAVFRQLDDATDVVRAVAFGDEDVAVRRDEDVVWLIEEFTVAAATLLAENHQQPALRAEFEDLMAATAVGDPDVVVGVDEDAVRKREDAGAEALDQLAGRIEVQDRIERRVRAGVRAAAFGDPDASSVLVDVHGARRAPHASFGELRPALDRAVRVGRIDRHVGAERHNGGQDEDRTIGD